MSDRIIDLLKGAAAGQTAGRGLGASYYAPFELVRATRDILSQDLSRLVAREGEYLLSGRDVSLGLVVHSTRVEWRVPIFSNAIEGVDQDIVVPEKRYEILLANCGNPDYGQDPNAPLPGVESGLWVPVSDAREASEEARRYISENNLGGGNWAGGLVRSVILKRTAARVSYNGRVWSVLRDKSDPTAGYNCHVQGAETSALNPSF
jgi:hypothetical protein